MSLYRFCPRLTAATDKHGECNALLFDLVPSSYLRFIVKVRQDGGQEISDERGFVVCGGVESDEGHSAHVEVGVFEGLEEVSDAASEEAVDRLRLVRDGELHSCKHEEENQDQFWGYVIEGRSS